MSDWLRHSGYEIWWLSQARIKHLVAAERMQLKWQLFCAFGQGRCRAITRLKKFHTARQRMGYAVARTLAAPFHCGLNLLVALASLPVKQGRLAVNALTRAVYIIGFARGLWDTHRSPPP
jgi:hypothetical protein